MNQDGHIEVRRVEHMKCPECGEVLPLDRDGGNMTMLPTCACGKRAGLGDLLGQMRDMLPRVSAEPAARRAGGEGT